MPVVESSEMVISERSVGEIYSHVSPIDALRIGKTKEQLKRHVYTYNVNNLILTLFHQGQGT